MNIDIEPKFHVVQTFSSVVDEFVVVAILSKRDEADEIAAAYRASKKHAHVGCILTVTMAEVVELLIQDRLRDLAEPLKRIASAVSK